MNHLFMDAKGFSQIEIGFEIEGPGLEVIKCRPVGHMSKTLKLKI